MVVQRSHRSEFLVALIDEGGSRSADGPIRPARRSQRPYLTSSTTAPDHNRSTGALVIFSDLQTERWEHTVVSDTDGAWNGH